MKNVNTLLVRYLGSDRAPLESLRNSWQRWCGWNTPSPHRLRRTSGYAGRVRGRRVGVPTRSPGTPCPRSASPPAGTPRGSDRTPSCHAFRRGTPRTRRRSGPAAADPAGRALSSSAPPPGASPGAASSSRCRTASGPESGGEWAARWRRKKSSRISSGASSTRRSGIRKAPASRGWRGLMFRPTARSSTPNRNPRKAWVVYVR